MKKPRSLLPRLLVGIQRFFYKRELRRIRREMGDRFHRETGGTVQAGPLAGMSLVREEVWGNDMTARLLGTYERELHEPLRELSRSGGYETIVVVGSAEGYWAVGLALLMPEATVRAFETDGRAREIAGRNARLNEVSERVDLLGSCTRRTLRHTLEDAGRSLCFVDVEGAEVDLLSLDAVPGLRSADLVVECHDRSDGSIRRRLADRFRGSHEVEFIDRRDPAPSQIEELSHYPDLEGWLAITEMRSRTSGWLLMRGLGIL